MRWFVIPWFLTLVSCGGSSNLTATDVADASAEGDQPLFADDGAPTTTKSPSNTPVINRDNHDAILAEVFKVFSGRAIESRLKSIPFLIDQFGPKIDDGSNDDAYSCDNGGRVVLDIIQDFGFFSTDFTYENCQLGDMLLEGDYRVIESDEETLRSSRGGLEVEFNGDTTISFNGLTAFSCCLSSIWYLRTRELEYNYASPAERFKIVGATTRFADGEDFMSDTRSASMTGNFVLETPVSGSEQLTVSIVEDFTFKSEPGVSFEESEQIARTWTFSQGRLAVVATDGSELLLDAESGDLATATITITNADGEESFDQPWSVWTGILNSADR